MGRLQRITNGQRAGVCGLAIAGVTLADACKIVGAPYERLNALLPRGWHKRPYGRPSKWVGAIVDELLVDWRDNNQTLASIATRWGVTKRALLYVAARQQWPRRRWGRKRAAVANPLLKMLPDQRIVYMRSLKGGLSHKEALREARA